MVLAEGFLAALFLAGFGLGGGMTAARVLSEVDDAILFFCSLVFFGVFVGFGFSFLMCVFRTTEKSAWAVLKVCH